MSANQRDLKTIDMELDRLYRLSEGLGLTNDDVVKLEKLIKAKALLEGNPTTISKSVTKTATDDEVLKALEAKED